MNKINLLNLIDEKVFSIPCKKPRLLNIRPDKINKILVIKLWALGDSVCLLPLIKKLRDKYPNAQIDVLVHKKNKCIFEGQSFIDNIITFNIFNILKIYKYYDLCIDAEPFLNVSAVIARMSAKYTMGFSHGIRSNMYDGVVYYNKLQHIVKNYMNFVSNYTPKKLIPLNIGIKDWFKVNDFLRDKISHNDFVVGIVPGVAESVKYRMWPLKKMAKLADKLIRSGKKVIFIDSYANIETVCYIMMLMDEKDKVINVAGLFNVKQAAEILRNCDVVVSNDSGLSHISVAMGVKTITLFGPNSNKLWGPYGKGNISIAKYKKGCPFIDNTNRKLIPDILTEKQKTCMDAISVQDVYKRIKR